MRSSMARCQNDSGLTCQERFYDAVSLVQSGVQSGRVFAAGFGEIGTTPALAADLLRD